MCLAFIYFCFLSLSCHICFLTFHHQFQVDDLKIVFWVQGSCSRLSSCFQVLPAQLYQPPSVHPLHVQSLHVLLLTTKGNFLLTSIHLGAVWLLFYSHWFHLGYLLWRGYFKSHLSLYHMHTKLMFWIMG